MPFSSSDEVLQKLRRGEPWTVGEVRAAMPLVSSLGVGGHLMLQAALTLETILAIKRFDESSTRLGRRLVWLTWVLVALTTMLSVPAFRGVIAWLR